MNGRTMDEGTRWVLWDDHTNFLGEVSEKDLLARIDDGDIRSLNVSLEDAKITGFKGWLLRFVELADREELLSIQNTKVAEGDPVLIIMDGDTSEHLLRGPDELIRQIVREAITSRAIPKQYPWKITE
jgi:hypothetical protein